MSWAAYSVHAPAFAGFKIATQTAIIVFFSYLIGTEAAFLIGTLSDNIFAPFWPPNVVLLTAMLLVGRDRIWLCILAAFPAHVIAEMHIGMPLSQMIVAFATNVAVASASVMVIWRFLGKAPWLNTFRKAAHYVAFVGCACPAVVAFGGAFVPMLGGASGTYAEFWLQWFLSNALGNLTLGPIALILSGEGVRPFWPNKILRKIEVATLVCALLAVTHFAFAAGAGREANLFLPSLLYVPLPLILWSAARFGAAGASISILTVTIDLIWRALNGPSLFLGGAPEANVFALQVFLVCLAVPVLLLGASIDQTRYVERQLREDEDRIALASAAANVGFWQYDITTDRLWLSDYARVLFDVRGDRPIEPSELLTAVHPDDAHLARQIMFEKEEAGRSHAIEFRMGPPGQPRWILARSHNPNGSTAVETSGIFIDSTARKASEAEAEQQRRELAHLMRVNQAGELSGGLAHEITQPLTAIMANAEAARLMLEAPRVDLSLVAEMLDDIIQDDHRAGEVIKRMRALLKNSEVRFEKVDLNDLVSSTLALLRNELINRRIRIQPDLELYMPTIHGDPVQLQQVLINLVMNAIEAVHQLEMPRRVISVRTRHGGDNMIEVRVADRGIGISTADEKRVFEPFFTTKERGLGLGLSICSTIIGRHEGTLSIENNSDDGATACVRLRVNGGSNEYEH